MTDDDRKDRKEGGRDSRRDDRPRGGDFRRGDKPRSGKPAAGRSGGASRAERSSGGTPRGDRAPGRTTRPDRPYGDKPRGERAHGGKPRGDRPYGDKPRGDRPYGDKPRSDRPFRDRSRNDGPRRDPAREGRDFERRGTGTGESFKQVRPEFDVPDIPEEIVATDLDVGARMQLKTLSKENAEQVARHLAMAAHVIDDDPALAHEHALAASRTAGRIGVVRETLAITAYQLQDFALALRELRTYRRITGNDDQLPLMVDCERGLGRPAKALELARSVDASTLPTHVRVELAIVKSGARLDLGQNEAALDELRIPELVKDKAFEWSPALFASYGTVLEELGRGDEATEWFELADRAAEALEQAFDRGADERVVVVEEEGAPFLDEQEVAELEDTVESFAEEDADAVEEQRALDTAVVAATEPADVALFDFDEDEA